MDYRYIFGLSEEEKESFIEEMLHIRSQLEDHVIPERYPDRISDMVANTLLIAEGLFELSRDRMIEASSYCIVSKDWVKELVPILRGKKCLEIMSGSGMLARAFQEEGIHVIATDSKEWNLKSCWCEVEKLDAGSAVREYGRDVDYIICSWIPYGSEAGSEALMAMRETNPDCRMIYIGEMGGCCGTERFADECVMEHDVTIRNANGKFRHWAGIHDQIFLLR